MEKNTNLNDFTAYLDKLATVKSLLSSVNLIDVDYYISEVAGIEKDVHELIGKNRESDIDFEEYIQELDKISETINNDYQELHLFELYVESVKEVANDITEDNYESILPRFKRLIEYIDNNKLLASNNKNDELTEANSLIYQGILNEAVFGKSEILNYVLSTKNSTLKQGINMLARKEIGKLSAEEKINLELNHRGNFLNTESIKIIVSHVKWDKVNEYQNKRRSALMEVLNERDSLLKEKNRITSRLKEREQVRKRERREFNKSFAKFAAGIGVPVMIFAGSVVTGLSVGRYHKIYKKVYNLETKKPVKDDTDYYNSGYYNYSVNLKKYTPWIKSDYSNSYIREVFEYDYTEKDDNESFDANRVLNEVTPKHSVEMKYALSEDDKMEDNSIVVTFLDMDKTDSSPGIVASFGFPVVGILVALLTLPFFLDHDCYEPEELKACWEELKNVRVKIKGIKEEYANIGGKIVKLQREYANRIVDGADIVAELDPELLKTAKKYVKKI